MKKTLLQSKFIRYGFSPLQALSLACFILHPYPVNFSTKLKKGIQVRIIYKDNELIIRKNNAIILFLYMSSRGTLASIYNDGILPILKMHIRGTL